jgi:phosphotransferase system IIB component
LRVHTPVINVWFKGVRARLKDTEKIKESEIENKENYIKELEDKNQQLTKSVINLKSICKDLEITKQLSAEMKEQIEKLEGEKELLDISTFVISSSFLVLLASYNSVVFFTEASIFSSVFSCKAIYTCSLA